MDSHLTREWGEPPEPYLYSFYGRQHHDGSMERVWSDGCALIIRIHLDGSKRLVGIDRA